MWDVPSQRDVPRQPEPKLPLPSMSNQPPQRAERRMR